MWTENVKGEQIVIFPPEDLHELFNSYEEHRLIDVYGEQGKVLFLKQRTRFHRPQFIKFLLLNLERFASCVMLLRTLNSGNCFCLLFYLYLATVLRTLYLFRNLFSKLIRVLGKIRM